jgi:hypothetical protein
MQNIADKTIYRKRSYVGYLALPLAVLCLITVPGSAFAQKSRAAVPASEVNGTFREVVGGKFMDPGGGEIRIWALGGVKLRIAMDLIYPYKLADGELTANTGELDGRAKIVGDTAVYDSNEFGPCRITIKFVRPGLIKVSQEGADADCGFGHNVSSDGTYKKISGRKPKFHREY